MIKLNTLRVIFFSSDKLSFIIFPLILDSIASAYLSLSHILFLDPLTRYIFPDVAECSNPQNEYHQISNN